MDDIIGFTYLPLINCFQCGIFQMKVQNNLSRGHKKTKGFKQFENKLNKKI
jgi:hypothetical protein